MNWLKFILIVLGLIFGAWVIFALLGFVYSILWYVFILGAIGVAGYIGYQFFKPDEKPQLKAKDDLSQIQFDSTTPSDRTLEEYKRKYLNK